MAALLAVLLILGGRSAGGGYVLAEPTPSDDSYLFTTIYSRWAHRFRAGESPFWYPEFAAGYPLPAAWMYGLLYPGLALFAVLPPETAWTWTAVLHLLLGAAGAYALVWKLRRDAAAAATAAVLFALSEFAIGRVIVGHMNLVMPLAWAPWVLVQVLRCVRGERAGVGGLALCLGVGLVSGHVQAWFYLGPLVAAFAVVAVAGATRRGPAAARVAMGAALAAAISCVQWAATVELVSAAGAPQPKPLIVEQCSAPPWFLAGGVAPGLFGRRPYGLGLVEPFEHEFAGVGALAVLLAILLALRLRDRRRWFWFAVLALAFVMATGTRTAVGSALAAVPPFSFGRTPARALMLAVLAGTLLAAHGVADWRAGRWQRPGLALAIGVGATLALGGVGAVVALRLGPVDALPGAAPRALVAAAASVVLVAAALLVARRFPRSWPLVPAAFCVGALLALPALRVAPSGFLHVDWAGRLPPGAQDHRVHVIGARYPFPELQSVRTIRDPSPVDLPGWHDFVAEPSPPLAWWLDVGTELVPGWTGPPHLESVPRLLENTWAGRLEPGGRARWFASAATSVADDEALVRLRSGERTLFVHDAAEPQEPGAAASITDRELTPLAEVRPPALGFDVGEPAPGWLFVSEKWHPAWHAEIDGAPAAVHRANLCLMAVRVPAGRHRVVLRPESTAFRWGAIVSAAGVLVASVLLLKRPKGRADA